MCLSLFGRKGILRRHADTRSLRSCALTDSLSGLSVYRAVMSEAGLKNEARMLPGHAEVSRSNN